MTWPDERILKLFDITVPILQAPMAGAGKAELAIAVAEGGGLGALPCAMLDAGQARAELAKIRAATRSPVNVNFFCHRTPRADAGRDLRWADRLRRYYVELGLDPSAAPPRAARAPFDDAMCAVVEEYRPEVVSFHFGLPERPLLDRVRATGAKVVGCATTVDEARWLEAEGCDAIVAQSFEAGGHRGMFLTEDVSRQVGAIALIPQVADAVRAPVIAAGGIADGRGIAAAFALGAAAVQIGTAYLLCPEAIVTAFHREALRKSKDDSTAITNVFTGRPARGIANRLVHEVGPISDAAPDFPSAAARVVPLRNAAESKGSADFSTLWSGQAGPLAAGRETGAAELTRRLAAEALERLNRLGAAKQRSGR